MILKRIANICFMSGIFSIGYWVIRYDMLGSHDPKYLKAAVIVMLVFFAIAGITNAIGNKIVRRNKKLAAQRAAIRKYNADMLKIVCNRVNMNIDV